VFWLAWVCCASFRSLQLVPFSCFSYKKDTSTYETRCVKIKGEKAKGEKTKETNKKEINKAAFFCKLPYLVWRVI
jgi:hypothetical protein